MFVAVFSAWRALTVMITHELCTSLLRQHRLALTSYSLPHTLPPTLNPSLNSLFPLPSLHTSLIPPSLSSSVATIGFDQTLYRVNESVGAAEVCASVRDGVVLQREVVVSYDTEDGSAMGMSYDYVMLHNNGYGQCHV